MSEEGKNNNSDQSTSVTTRRKTATTRMKETEEKPNRPTSLELKTDWTNTETKLIILDFLSSQSIEHLTARNAPGDGRKSSQGKVCKSASDGSSHEPSYRKRSAKLANYARPLRKQYYNNNNSTNLYTESLRHLNVIFSRTLLTKEV